MKGKLKSAALALVQRATKAGLQGSLADLDALLKLNKQCHNRIPSWYIELITSIPLCNLDLGWQSSEHEDDDSIWWMRWSDVAKMRIEMIESYPGLAILQRGYINVAIDSMGGGDPYFIPTNKSEDPPLYQIYHDVSDQPDEILQEGLELVAVSVSEFFEKAIVEA